MLSNSGAKAIQVGNDRRTGSKSDDKMKVQNYFYDFSCTNKFVYSYPGFVYLFVSNSVNFRPNSATTCMGKTYSFLFAFQTIDLYQQKINIKANEVCKFAEENVYNFVWCRHVWNSMLPEMRKTVDTASDDAASWFLRIARSSLTPFWTSCTCRSVSKSE